MLRRLVEEIESAEGALDFRTLARRLEVEESALEGMLEHLVRQGRLRVSSEESADSQAATGACGLTRACSADCPFGSRAPRMISIAPPDSDEDG